MPAATKKKVVFPTPDFPIIIMVFLPVSLFKFELFLYLLISARLSTSISLEI